MEIIKHDVANKINYFNLLDFISKIKLDSKVLDHMQETNLKFDEYFTKLSKYNDSFVLDFWVSLAYDEIRNSKFVENHQFSDFDISRKDLFFERLSISHNRIHDIHKFVMKDEKNYENPGCYRKTPVEVSHIEDAYKEIFWYGAEPEDVKKFMDDFINVYKINNMSVLFSNSFLKSALIHLLFIKIHPYTDGNGRTGRILHNIKFTESFDRNYGMKLKICPVNLSKSININKVSYVNALDNIYFDLDHDNNEYINCWFNFILNMYDEQLFMNQNMINDMDQVMEKIMSVKERLDRSKEKQKLLTR